MGQVLTFECNRLRFDNTQLSLSYWHIFYELLYWHKITWLRYSCTLPSTPLKTCVEDYNVKTKILLCVFLDSWSFLQKVNVNKIHIGEIFIFMDSWFFVQTENVNNIHTSISREGVFELSTHSKTTSLCYLKSFWEFFLLICLSQSLCFSFFFNYLYTNLIWLLLEAPD